MAPQQRRFAAATDMWAMRICVIGAGAIGGLLAAKLSRAGEQVSVVARGPHLAAIARDGLDLLEDGEEIVARVKASERIAEAGEQDLIVLGMKAHQVAAVTARPAGDPGRGRPWC